MMIKFLCAFLLCCAAAQAQTFPVDTVMMNGPTHGRINLVFLSDGYTQNEMKKFSADIRQILDKFFSTTPFREYKVYFNAFAVKVPSEESGVSHPGTAHDCDLNEFPANPVVNNYFGSTFDFGGSHRSLLATNSFAVSSVLQASFPEYNQVIVVANTPHYGGTASDYCTISGPETGSEVVMHEIGHILGKLGEEYGGSGGGNSWEAPNTTQISDREKLRWKKWVRDGTPFPTPVEPKYYNRIGLFEGAANWDAGWYRPRYDCKMRSSYQPFCEVCVEAFVERFHQLVPALISSSPFRPDHYAYRDTSFVFSVELLQPDPPTIQRIWSLNGKEVLRDRDSFRLSLKGLKPGAYTVSVNYSDTTLLSRSDDHAKNHRHTINWIVDKLYEDPKDTIPKDTVPKDTTVIDTTKKDTTISSICEDRLLCGSVEIYPQPAKDKLYIEFRTALETEIVIELLSQRGEKVGTLLGGRLDPGSFRRLFDIRPFGLSPGLYLVRIRTGRETVLKKIMLD